MTSPPLYYHCKKCNQEIELMNPPIWFKCSKCKAINKFYNVFGFTFQRLELQK